MEVAQQQGHLIVVVVESVDNLFEDRPQMACPSLVGNSQRQRRVIHKASLSTILGSLQYC